MCRITGVSEALYVEPLSEWMVYLAKYHVMKILSCFPVVAFRSGV